MTIHYSYLSIPTYYSSYGLPRAADSTTMPQKGMKLTPQLCSHLSDPHKTKNWGAGGIHSV